MNRNILRHTGLVVGGVCIGGGVGYIVAMKHLENRYRRVALEAIEEAKEFYSLLRSVPPYDNPVTATRAYLARLDQLTSYVTLGVPQEDIDEYNGVSDLEDEDLSDEDAGEVFINMQPNPESELEPPVIYDQLVRERNDESALEATKDALLEAAENIRMTTEPPTQAQHIVTLEDVTSKPTDLLNVFAPDVVEKYELEVADELPQTSKATYIITVDEFMEENHDYEKVSLMYYEADDTLADDADKIIRDFAGTIGKESLKYFGKGSKDENVVYIRNDATKMLFEVCKDERSYPVAVLGIANSVMNKKVPRSDDG